MTQQEQTRRERRALARRAQILDAAVKVFIEKGFHRATTKDIAEAADVAEGTIYNYFDSKDHLLMALLAQLAQIEARTEIFTQALNTDLRVFFESYFRMRMDEIAATYPVLLAILPEVMSTPHLRAHYYGDFLRPAMQTIENHVRARIEQGQIRDLDVALTVRLFVSMLVGLQFMLLLDDPELKAAWDNPDTLVAAIAGLILDGVEPR